MDRSAPCAVIDACAATTPPPASAPTRTLSQADLQALELWSRLEAARAVIADLDTQIKAAWAAHGVDNPRSNQLYQRQDVVIGEKCIIMEQLEALMSWSAHAIAGLLAISILEEREFLLVEQFDGISRAVLRVLRPQLSGSLAEAADRALAQGKEALS